MILAHEPKPEGALPVTRPVTQLAGPSRTPRATSAPSAFVVIASSIIDGDRLEVLLRGEHVGTIDGAKRHAVSLLLATAQRFGAACVDVVDGQGCPVFFVSTAGGAS